MTISVTTPTKKTIKPTKPKKNTKPENTKKKYRGKGKTNSRKSTFSILLSNMRGYKSKEPSLKKILKKQIPSMVILNETQLIGKMQVNLSAYTTWNRNRTEKGGGGIATAVHQQYSATAVGVGEGEHEDKYLITRVEAFEPALNVINSYGEQRSTQKEEVEHKWSRLRKEMENIRIKGEFCCLGGDLNKLLGCDQLGVPGTSPDISLGGRLLRDLLATGDWLLVNGLGEGVVEGGPNTRKDPATGKMSRLDLFLISIGLRPYISSLQIDKDLKFTPYRAIKKKKKFKLVYSDHFASILTLKNLPRKQERQEKKVKVWNLAKENGWENYKYLTDKYSDKIENIIEDKSH